METMEQAAADISAQANERVENDTELKEMKKSKETARTKKVKEEHKAWINSLVELEKVDIEPTEFYIPGALSKRNMTIFSADGGCGKSTACIYIALALALSRKDRSVPIFGRDFDDDHRTHEDYVWETNKEAFGDKGIDTVFVSWEDEAGQIKSNLTPFASFLAEQIDDFAGLEDLGKNGNGQIYFSQQLAGEPLYAAKGGRSKRASLQPKGQAFFDAMKEINPGLIILDPLAAVYAGNENDRMEVRGFTTKIIDFVKDTGIALIIISHRPKTGAEYSGSTDWHASARGLLTLQRVPIKVSKEQVPKEEKEQSKSKVDNGNLIYTIQHDEEGLIGYSSGYQEESIMKAHQTKSRPMYLRSTKQNGGPCHPQLIVAHTQTKHGNILMEVSHARRGHRLGNADLTPRHPSGRPAPIGKSIDGEVPNGRAIDYNDAVYNR